MTLEETDLFAVERFVIGPLETNCYLIYDKKSKKGILIDPGVYDREVSECIKKNGLDVINILNTHGHADHITGDRDFGFPVLIHELDEPCLKNPLKNLSVFSGGNISLVKAQGLLKDGDVIEVGDLKLEVVHTPGHTPGGISVKCDNLLFSGDTLFFEGVGRTDLPGGDYSTLVKSIKEKLFTLPLDTKVFPGHGPETTIGHEKEYNPFVD